MANQKISELTSGTPTTSDTGIMVQGGVNKKFTFGDLPITTSVETALDSKQDTSEKGQINGYASLDSEGKVPSSQLPAGQGAVDSVNGKTGIVELDTDDIPEGINKYISLDEKNAISHTAINGKNGFGISIDGGNITYSIASGDLQFVNRTTGVITTKTYSGVTGLTPTFFGATTYITIDQSKITQPTLDLTITYQADYTYQDLREGRILIGKLGTPGGGIIELLPISWNYFDQDISNAEFISAIAPVINENSSNIIEAGTGMTINKTSGALLVRGANTLITNPNRISTGLLISPTMRGFYRNGSGGRTVVGGITAFNPNLYDDGTGVLATVGNNKWTTTRIYLTSSNLILFEYGQKEYSTQVDALNGLLLDTYNRLVSQDSILLGAVAMKKDDTQILNNNIKLANKLGEIGAGGVASSVTTTWGSIIGTLSNQTDLQNALDAKANLSGATFTGGITATNLSGTNTGDQDLSGLALKTNVLELNNTTPFTPDADYEPATKKYVDDNAGGGGFLREVSITGTQYVNNILFEGAIGKATTLTAGYITLLTAPTGADFVITIYKSTDSGATYPTSETVTLTAGSKYEKTALTTAFAEGDWMKAIITQIGSTIAGQDLLFSITGS